MYLLVTGFYAFLSHLDYLYAAVAAYLCGCFNGALFTSRLFFHDDVRTHGSGNAGLTNFYRTYGARYALLVIACDMLKAVAAVSLAAWLGARFDPRMLPDLPLTAAEQAEYVLHFKYWAGFFCVVGHHVPLYGKIQGRQGHPVLRDTHAAARLAHRAGVLEPVRCVVADDALCVARLGERGGGLPGHDAPCVRRRVCDRIFRSDRGARALCAP